MRWLVSRLPHGFDAAFDILLWLLRYVYFWHAGSPLKLSIVDGSDIMSVRSSTEPAVVNSVNYVTVQKKQHTKHIDPSQCQVKVTGMTDCPSLCLPVYIACPFQLLRWVLNSAVFCGQHYLNFVFNLIFVGSFISAHKWLHNENNRIKCIKQIQASTQVNTI